MSDMGVERRSARELDLEEQVRELKEQLLLRDRQLKIDDRTGAFSSRGFKEEMEELGELARNGKLEHLTLIYADIDDFKEFNDIHGHDFGDEVLKLVATAMQYGGRKTDTAARLGGDEFVLVLPGATEEIAQRVVSQIEEELRASPVRYRGTEVFVNITMGMASYPETSSIEELEHVADEKMRGEKVRKSVGR